MWCEPATIGGMTPTDELAVIEAELDRRKALELKAIEHEIAKRQYKQFLRARYDDWQERYDHIAKTVFDSPWIGGMGYFPHPKQLHFLSEYDIREVFFGGGGAGGKALRTDTPVPTPSGWTTMGELRPGDQVIGDDGKPTSVVWTSGVMHDRECYKLVFDDGTEVVADADHQWVTLTTKERTQLARRNDKFRAKRRQNRPSRVSGNKSAKFTESLTRRNRSVNKPAVKEAPSGTVRTTREIAETLLDRRGHYNHAIPLAKPIESPPADLPIDPYLLGVWLGDGHSAGGSITSADPEIPNAFSSAGYKVTKHATQYGWGVHGLHRQLRLNGLLNNKHVPAAYLRASREQRLAILQGLMDTDGCANQNGSVEFCNTNRKLILAAHELAISLGHKVAITEGIAKLNGREIGPKYRMKWTPPECVFRLPRKAVRQKLGGANTRHRIIVSCEPVESVPVCCIAVDNASKLFLATESMVPTHNSMALWFAALQYVHVPGYAALILRRTYADLAKPGALMDRSRAYLNGTDAVWNERDKRWTFPSGASITFGYLQNESDKYQYASAEFQKIGFDELTHFDSSQYTFLFSRLRKPSGGELSKVPLRMRSASNPGASGHQWVFERFVNEDTKKADAVYVPSLMDDNPSCNIEEYRASLANVDPITRRQMEHGDWSAVEGGRFKREWFKRWRWADDGTGIVLNDHRGPYHFDIRNAPLFASCDPAASASTAADFTVFGVWANTPRGDLVWVDCIRRQVDIPDQPKLLAEVCAKHKLMAIGIEAELSNRAMYQFAERMMLPVVRMTTKGKDKLARANIAMIHAEAGRIWIPEQSANPSFPVDDVLAELSLFTGTKKDRRDDCVDVLSYGCELREKLGYATMGKQERPGWYDSVSRVRGGR